MASTRLSNIGTAQSASLVPDSDSAAEYNQGLRVLMAAAVRDGDEAALSELQEIEPRPSQKS